MQHLSDEAVARIVDEDPSETEAAHLSACSVCRAELAAARAQVHALGEMPDLEPPRALALRLQSGLAAEGLLLGRRTGRLRALRIAASIALFAAGGLAGFIGRGATSPPPVASLLPAGSVNEAAERLQQAEAHYNAALIEYVRTGGDLPSPDPLNRLAALEGIVLTTRAALNESPADPVINGYHLTALEQRDALLRRIGTFDPNGAYPEQEWF